MDLTRPIVIKVEADSLVYAIIQVRKKITEMSKTVSRPITATAKLLRFEFVVDGEKDPEGYTHPTWYFELRFAR